MTDQTGSTSEVDQPRRGLVLGLGGLCLAWLAGGVYPVLKFLSPQAPPDVFGEDGRALADGITAASVAEPGAGASGSYGNHGLIVFRNKTGELKAFDSKCTHAGCNVEYQGERIYCHCHGGTYDLNGKNIAGPPPKPLTELRVIEEGDSIYVARLEEGEGAES